jgi:hypothetical protein
MANTIDRLGTTLTINARGSTVSVGTTNGISIVGGYDVANAADSVTAGEAVAVNGGTQAARLFGEGSELHRAVAAASPIRSAISMPFHCLRSNTPNLHWDEQRSTVECTRLYTGFNPEHEITATDTTDGSTV